MQSDEFGTERLDRVLDGNVTNQSTDIVGHLHIGRNVHMSAKSDSQRLIHKSHLIEVDAIQIGGYGGIQLLRVQQGINVDFSVDERVTTIDVCQRMTVLDIGHHIHIVQIPMSVAQTLYLSISHQTGAGRQEVGTLPFHVDIGRNGIDGIARHEVVDVQIADVHLGIVTHQVGIKLSLQLQRALAFLSHDISDIIGAIGLHAP